MRLISSRLIKLTCAKLICVGTLSLFSFSTFAHDVACAFNNLVNLNYQLQVTSPAGTLRNINISRKNMLLDREFGTITILVDVRPILEQRAFRNGIAKFKLTSRRDNTANDQVFVDMDSFELERPNAPIPKRLTDDNFPFVNFLDIAVGQDFQGAAEFKEFGRGERINISQRPFRQFRKDVDVVIADIFCNFDPDDVFEGTFFGEEGAIGIPF